MRVLFKTLISRKTFRESGERVTLLACFMLRATKKSVFKIMLIEDELNTYHFVKIKCITY